MLTVSRFSLDAFPDSPYAAELRRGRVGLRFSCRLETEYLRAHLLQNRSLIRVACIFGMLLAIARAAEQLATGSPTLMPVMLGSVIASSALLCAIAWSPWFERHYLSWATIIVPLRSVLVAGCVARLAAQGQVEMLMVLTIVLIGPFFFFGLPFRWALFCGMASTASFTACAFYFGLELPIALRACVWTYMALAACAVAAVVMEKRSRIAFLETNLITQIAEQDSLTGTKNRRVFDEHLAWLWLRAASEGRCMSILLIDVDDFKAYNDCYGHQAGDQALRRVAQTVQGFVRRPLDILARYGGEEFVAVLYDVGGPRAKEIAEQVRRAVEDMHIEHRTSRARPIVTISIGVAALEPTRERDSRGALQLADQALYEAKTRGRNCVALMNEAEYQMLVTGVFSRDAPRAANS